MIYAAQVKQTPIYWGIVVNHPSVGTGIVKVDSETAEIESLHKDSESVPVRRFVRDKPAYYGVLYRSFAAAYEDSEGLIDS